MEIKNKVSKVSGSSKSYQGVGRRKSAVARVWIKKGSGVITVNGKNVNDYFDTDVTKSMVAQPLVITGLDRNVDVVANVSGSGMVGQAGAVRLGISRALIEHDETLRIPLKQYKLLTVDSRLKERKKYGQKAARRKFQFVKR